MKHLKTFWNRRYLLWELVKKGIKLKYRRSYLGIIWSLLEPILTTIVLTIVFGTLLGRGGRDFPMYILCGRLMYSYFSTSTKAAARSIRSNASMIKKVYVPKYLYPMASVLFNFIIFLISLVVLVPLDIYGHIGVSLSWLLIFIPLILLLLMTFGVGMILSTITVFFRDMEYLWDVILMIIMYTAAIFYYPEKLLASGYSWILKYNPLYCVVDLFRSCVLNKPLSMYNLMYALGFSVVSVLIGTVVFYKKQDEFILNI